MKRRIHRKTIDFHRKLACILVGNYDLIFIEDLDVKEMLEGDGNAKSKQDVAWAQFRDVLTHIADKHGMLVVPVDAEGATMGYSNCDTST